MPHPETYEYYFKTYGYGEHCVDGVYFRVSLGSVIFFKNATFHFTTWHRLDGPAKIRKDGNKVWYINRKVVTDKIYQWAKENDIDLDNLSEDDKLLIKLVWS